MQLQLMSNGLVILDKVLYSRMEREDSRPGGIFREPRKRQCMDAGFKLRRSSRPPTKFLTSSFSMPKGEGVPKLLFWSDRYFYADKVDREKVEDFNSY